MNLVTDELMKTLNPTVLTSRASMMGGAANGDKYAQKLLERIQNDDRFDRKHRDPDIKPKDDLFRFSSAYGTAVWVRNRIADRLFESLRMSSFVDLGCGINPRGLGFLKRGGVRYYGIDLPSVTEKMIRSLQPTISVDGMAGMIMYRAVDVTDRDALRALFRVKEPLFIVTEGLMMYLTESEMKTVVSNISELLAEFGGVWFTCDSEERALFEQIFSDMLGTAGEASENPAGIALSEQWRKLMYNNSFVTLKDDELTDFLADVGLNCRRVGVKMYMNDLDIPNRIQKAYENTKFLMMTSALSSEYHMSPQNRTFELVSDTFTSDALESGVEICIYGRLDTLTAPKLVEEYEKYTSDGKPVPVVIDMAYCPYISSAGIRAVLLLYKKTSKIKKGFSLKNITPDVLDILNTTGFSEFFGDIDDPYDKE